MESIAAVMVVVATTAFGYGFSLLFERRPLSTADLAVGALAGLAGLALARAFTTGGAEVGLLIACCVALCLQMLRGRAALGFRG